MKDAKILKNIDKAAKRAAALRENLKRRKAQEAQRQLDRQKSK